MTNRSEHESGRPRRVAIVGGGPGGLFTATCLEQLAAAPLEVTIFEASDRLGGKVLTPCFTSAPIHYEAGAAEFYDYSQLGEDPLRELVRSLGLPTVSMGGGAVYLSGRPVANLDDAADLLGDGARAAVTAFDTWARSAMTPVEFYESGSDHDASAALPGRFCTALGAVRQPAVRRYLETMIHSDLATEPNRTSIGYGLQNYLMNDPAYMRLYCIAGGNERMIAALASRLAADLRLGTPVVAVGGEPGGRMEIVSHPAGSARRETFDAVILAVPMDALEKIDFMGEELAAAMRRHVVHHDHPAHYLRVTLLLDRPVPAGCADDSYLMLDAFGGCCLYVESAREPAADHGVLGWLLGGEAAEALAHRPDDDLVATVLESLPATFAAVRGHVVEARVHRWRGAVSGVPGGWRPLPLDRRHRPAAGSHPLVFVVGDYLFDATLNGVLESAEYVAGWVAAELDGLSRER